MATTLTTADLTSAWRLDEASDGTAPVSRLDAIGTNHLTDSNTVASAAGQIGTAASFTAANSEQLSIATNPTLEVSGKSFTVTGWTYTAVSGPPITKDDVTSNRAWSTLWDGSSNRYRAFFWGPLPGSNLTTLASPNNSAPANTWNHIAFGYDADADTLFLDANGTVTTAAFTHGVASGAAPFRIGAHTTFFDGRIDEVCLWNRALTTAERGLVRRIGQAGYSVVDVLDAGGGSSRPVLSSPHLIGSLG